MKRNKLASTLLVFLALAMCAGCAVTNNGAATPNAASTEQPAEAAASAVPADGAKVTLRVASLAGVTTDMFKLAKEAFIAEHPNVDIEIVEFDSSTYMEKGPQVFGAAENNFDVAWYYRAFSWQDMCDAGYFLPLDDLYTSEDWFSALGTPVTDLYKNADGHYYSVCESVVWIDNMYYNKDLMEKYGWSVPTTWDEFVAFSEAAQKEGLIPLAQAGGSGAQEWLMDILLTRMFTPEEYQLACDPTQTTLRYDSEQWINAWKAAKEMQDSGMIEQGASGVNTTDAQALFLSGKAVMIADGSWAGNVLQSTLDGDANGGFKVGYAMIPAYNDSIVPKIPNYPCNCVMVLSTTKQPDLAKSFVQLIMSKSQQEALAKAAINNPARTDVSAESVSALGELTVSMYQDMVKYGVVPMWSVLMPQEMLDAMNTACDGVLTGVMTPDEAGAYMQQKYEEVLAN